MRKLSKYLKRELAEWMFILVLGVLFITIDFPLSLILVILLIIIWKLMNKLDKQVAKSMENRKRNGKTT